VSKEQITIAAAVAAPLEKVWECWTEPEHITQWNFASDDWCCPSAANELQVGGRYKARMEAKDGSFGFDFEAIYDEIELPKDILRFKAQTMGRKQIAWYDLGAPLDIESGQTLSWPDAQKLVEKSFSASYPALGNYARSAFDKKWIDWEPREGKRPGGFCTGSLLTKESRIFMTYNETLGDVLTLVWGEDNGGTSKPTVESHEQTEVRVKVSATPYARDARESYHSGWRTRLA